MPETKQHKKKGTSRASSPRILEESFKYAQEYTSRPARLAATLFRRNATTRHLRFTSVTECPHDAEFAVSHVKQLGLRSEALTH